MSSGITGVYEGEGANVTAGSGGAALVPDVAGMGSSTTSGQGRQASVAVTRRRQLRVSSEGARSGLVISYGGGDQILTKAARGVLITTSGNLTGRLAEDTADINYAGLLQGTIYPLCFAIVRQTGSTAAGVLLF